MVCSTMFEKDAARDALENSEVFEIGANEKRVCVRECRRESRHIRRELLPDEFLAPVYLVAV